VHAQPNPSNYEQTLNENCGVMHDSTVTQLRSKLPVITEGLIHYMCKYKTSLQSAQVFKLLDDFVPKSPAIAWDSNNDHLSMYLCKRR